MPEIRLAVVIPALEFNELLRLAVDSVAADLDASGTHEIVVVVDGPESPIPEWIDERLTRVVFTGARGGAGRAINLGIGSTSAAFIGRLDADDIWERGRAAAQLEVLERNASLSLVAGGGTIIDEHGSVVGPYPPAVADDARRLLLRRNPIIHSAVMFRRSAWEKAGRYDPTLIRMQDYDLWLRVAMDGGIRLTKDRVVRYRVHGAQSSRRPRRFLRLMMRISARRIELARSVGSSVPRQLLDNAVFTVAQALRYARLRRPGYELKVLARPDGQARWTGLRALAGRACARFYTALSRGRIEGTSFILRRPGLLRIEREARLRIGADVMIAESARIVVSDALSIGDGVFISKNVTLVAYAPLSIGDRTLIGENVSIHTEDHGPFNRRDAFLTSEVHVGSDTWIGAGAVITRGVRIGDRATVGANAVVTRDVADGETVVGVPARPLAGRNEGAGGVHAAL